MQVCLLHADAKLRNAKAPGFDCPGPRFKRSKKVKGNARASLKCYRGMCVSAQRGRKRAKLGEQCGGRHFKGPRHCQRGLLCKSISSKYSECVKEVKPAELWFQCGGGKDWTGPTVCKDGYPCVRFSDTYAQCLPALDQR